MRYFLGIDPGKSGAWAIISEDRTNLFYGEVPTIKKEYDKHKMIELIRNNQKSIIHAVLEDVHANQISGRTGAFEFGRGKGLWEMVLCALDISHTMVQPKAWQKQMWEGVPKAMKPDKIKPTVDTKATSLIAAKRLFPKESFILPKCRTPHDGIIDAVLMAEYCRRNFR